MNLIDTHCHLDSFGAELDSVLQRAKNAFVEAMIACGTEATDWPLHYEISNRYPHIHYSVGIHPTNVTPNWEADLETLEQFFSKTPKPIAMGEIGLDYHGIIGDATVIIARQKEAFRQQLAIARQRDCPIIIHSRNAFEDCKTLIDQSQCNWEKIVIHCFSEDDVAIREINSRGGRGSFTGIVTYKNAEKIRQALLAQGVERLMLETDSPYLAPVPFRSKQNEPAFVRETARYVAKLLGVPESELCTLTTQNAKQFFHIKDLTK
ncbi:MAG: TatD family hydrolase [Puniceicoccales bacterium]|jgi:TatD DNase family protein|nr:TatD family hydrolase [Puniceicoccales bacterium]